MSKFNLVFLILASGLISGCFGSYYYAPMPGAQPGMPASQAQAICNAQLRQADDQAKRDAYNQALGPCPNCGGPQVAAANRYRAQAETAFVGVGIGYHANCMATKGFQKYSKEP